MNLVIYILLCLIWGSTWWAIKLGLADVPPLWSAGLRFVVSGAIMWAIVALKRYPLPDRPSDFWRLSYPGVYMYGLSYGLIYFAEGFISSALTAVLFASFPLFVALLSIFMLKSEKLKVLAWVGIGIGMVGILIISWDSLQLSGNIFLGTTLALLGSLAAAYGMLLHKKRFSDRNIYSSIAIQITVGGLPLLLAALLFEDMSPILISYKAVGSILYLSVLGTVVAFVGYYWLLARIRAVALALIGFITPILAVFIGVALANETLTATTIIGTIIILFGVLLVVRDR